MDVVALPHITAELRKTAIKRFTQRVELFNWWGEQLTAAQHGAKIITLSGESYSTS
jgi:hypothetical protein